MTGHHSSHVSFDVAVSEAGDCLAEHRIDGGSPLQTDGCTIDGHANSQPVEIAIGLSCNGQTHHSTDGARIELAVSQAAFKYRYSVIRPAQVPRDPVRPNLKLVASAGVFASMLLALTAVVGQDLLSRRIFESWQVERRLGLPVMGSIDS